MCEDMENFRFQVSGLAGLSRNLKPETRNFELGFAHETLWSLPEIGAFPF